MWAGLAFLALTCSTGWAAPLIPPHPFSKSASGTTGASFLKVPVGARALAIGEAHVAAAQGVEAVYYNPAGLSGTAQTGQHEIGATFSTLLETAYLSSLSYVRAFQDVGALGVGLVHHSQGPITSYNALGDPGDAFHPFDLALNAAFGREFWDDISLGASVKLIHSKLADVSGTGLAVDLGLQVHNAVDTGEGPVDLGVAVQNFGPPFTLGSASDPLPLKIAAGLYWRAHKYWSLMADLNFPVDHDPYVGGGVELQYPFPGGSRGFLRGGYSMRNAQDKKGLSGPTAGIGLDLPRLGFDYAWVPFGDLGTTHRILITFRF